MAAMDSFGNDYKVTVEGFEPTTCCSGGSRSIQLSYTADRSRDSNRVLSEGKVGRGHGHGRGVWGQLFEAAESG